MKIRSITYLCSVHYPLREEIIRKGGEFLAGARSAYEAAGFEVQTLRLATDPFPNYLGRQHLRELPKLAERLDGWLAASGIGYASLGPALPELPESFDLIPEAIGATKNVFFGGVMADRQQGIALQALRACASVIVRAATLEPNGFANLRFAALANVQPGSPFLPAAYHDGGAPTFAIATEAGDLAVEAFTQQRSLEAGRAALVAQIERQAQRLGDVASTLNAKFGGIDFSLAPFPAEAQSLATAFERMGVPRAGLHGSLAAAAILTEAIDRARFSRTGFSGLMLPVLEDATLAARAADGTLSVKDVLLYSAVCGTGLDTVPLPGDTTAEQLTAVLLDLSALALRLDKPLTARLMPVPGKRAGEATTFDFGFFANSRVMALDSEGLGGALNGPETFPLTPRPR